MAMARVQRISTSGRESTSNEYQRAKRVDMSGRYQYQSMQAAIQAAIQPTIQIQLYKYIHATHTNTQMQHERRNAPMHRYSTSTRPPTRIGGAKRRDLQARTAASTADTAPRYTAHRTIRRAAQGAKCTAPPTAHRPPLHYSALHYRAIHCAIRARTPTHRTAPSYTLPHYTTLHYTVPRYTPLHYTALP